MLELRGRPTLKGAYIVFNEGRSTISCVVKHLSESGAKLEVRSATGIPTAFRLVLNDQTAHACWIVRRSGREIGVAFTDWDPSKEALQQ